MRRRQIAVVVLDQMQVLYQQVAPARSVSEQRAYFLQRLRVNLTALGRAWRSPPAAFIATYRRSGRLRVHRRIPSRALGHLHVEVLEHIALGLVVELGLELVLVAQGHGALGRWGGADLVDKALQVGEF